VEVAVVCSAVGNILWELVAAAEQSLYGNLHELHLLVADLVEHTIEDPAERDTVKSKINENGDFVDALFKQLDLNGDGVVEFHEFTKAYHKVLEHYLANH